MWPLSRSGSAELLPMVYPRSRTSGASSTPLMPNWSENATNQPALSSFTDRWPTIFVQEAKP